MFRLFIQPIACCVYVLSAALGSVAVAVAVSVAVGVVVAITGAASVDGVLVTGASDMLHDRHRFDTGLFLFTKVVFYTANIFLLISNYDHTAILIRAYISDLRTFQISWSNYQVALLSGAKSAHIAVRVGTFPHDFVCIVLIVLIPDPSCRSCFWNIAEAVVSAEGDSVVAVLQTYNVTSLPQPITGHPLSILRLVR